MAEATQWILIIAVGVLAFWDTVAFSIVGVEATISRVVYAASVKYPIIAFAVGVVCGHIFW